MNQPIDEQLKTIRRRVRQVLLVYGLSWFVVVLFSSTLCIGFLDWLFHLNDSGVRLILAMSIAGSSLWVLWRYLLWPMQVPLTDLDLALKIEQRYPGFRDSLASSVQFLEDDIDPRNGSIEMQQRVISRTLEHIKQIDVTDIIQTRSVRRLSGVALVVSLVVATVVGFNQIPAAIAVTRLVMPFSDFDWPKTTQLRFVDSKLQPIDLVAGIRTEIARGATLEIFVVNENGRLPDQVELETRLDKDPVTSELLRKTTLRDKNDRPQEVFVATLTARRGPMAFRAVGGDDQEMLWYLLDIVPPPQVDSLEVVLTPPEYAQQPTVELPRDIGHIQGLVGTRVDVKAAVNKSLASAMLHLKDADPGTLVVSKNGIHLSASFEIGEAGLYSYWFALKDRQGFDNSNASRFEIRGIADLVPEVYFETPSSDIQVTTNAQLPLRVVAKDDLGLKAIHLRYKVNDGRYEQHLSSDPGTGDTRAAELGFELYSSDARPDHHKVEHLWDLSPLKLQHGMRVVMHAEATDYYDLDEAHVGRSITRTLVVVSAEEKTAELAARQASILDELDRAFKMQSRAQQHVGELRKQLDTVGKLRSVDVDTLKRVKLDQDQISSRLLNPVDGANARTAETLREFRNNHLDDADSEHRLEKIADEFAMIKDGAVPIIESELTLARKGVETGDQNLSSQSLAKTAEAQAEILDSLNEMRKLLSKWRDQQDLTSELKEIVNAQKLLNQESADFAKSTLNRKIADLTPQQQADVAKLRDRQQQLSERLEQFRKRIEETAGKLEEQNSASADPLWESITELDRRATTGHMREASERIRQNLMGEAIAQQQSILEDLTELSNILERQDTNQVAELVKNLKQTENELEVLRTKETEVLSKLDRLQQINDSQQRKQGLEQLRQEQREIREQINEMARRLRRLQARQSSESVRRAVHRMTQAERNLEQEQLHEAAENVQESLDDLEQAARQLAETRRQLEEQLAQEHLERIADALKGLIRGQQAIIDETIRIDIKHRKRITDERKSIGNWKRNETKQIRQLAEVQSGLVKETDDLITTLKPAEVFALALSGASRAMQQAATRLKNKQPDLRTVEFEKHARQRFIDLASALKLGKSETGPTPQGEVSSQGTLLSGVPQLAQLKMLKSMQDDINRRTEELDAVKRQNPRLTANQLQDQSDLAEEQGKLADLLQNFTQAVMKAFKANGLKLDNGTDKEEIP